jgi:hypothetical protein
VNEVVIRNAIRQDKMGWSPSVYYAEGTVSCSLQNAWRLLLDYEAWNPSFIGAQVSLVAGKKGSEGEIVLIKKSIVDANGEPWPQFYAETVKLVREQHIVWYLYPKEGDAFRNFVDFGLSEVGSGVRFNIYYYSQTQVAGEALAQQRTEMKAALGDLVTAFQNHCAGNA